MTPGVTDTTAGTPPPEATGADAAPARRAPAPETARLYAIDWHTFAVWCQEVGLTALPAAPATAAAFLAAAGERISAGALGRRAAAIGDRHRQLGLTAPTADSAVRAILRRTRRAATPRRKPRSKPTQLQRMAAACPGDLAGMRDRALLLRAAAGLGRAALVGLDAERLRFTTTAVELTLPQPGPDACRAVNFVAFRVPENPLSVCTPRSRRRAGSSAQLPKRKARDHERDHSRNRHSQHPQPAAGAASAQRGTHGWHKHPPATQPHVDGPSDARGKMRSQTGRAIMCPASRETCRDLTDAAPAGVRLPCPGDSAVRTAIAAVHSSVVWSPQVSYSFTILAKDTGLAAADQRRRDPVPGAPWQQSDRHVPQRNPDHQANRPDADQPGPLLPRLTRLAAHLPQFPRHGSQPRGPFPQHPASDLAGQPPSASGCNRPSSPHRPAGRAVRSPGAGWPLPREATRMLARRRRRHPAPVRSLPCVTYRGSCRAPRAARGRSRAGGSVRRRSPRACTADVSTKAAADALEDVRIKGDDMKISPVKAVPPEAAEDPIVIGGGNGSFCPGAGVCIGTKLQGFQTLVDTFRNRGKSVGNPSFFPCVDSARQTLCIMCRRHPTFPT